ncbi:MAG: hypothetical protein AAF581_03500 [Planctomycetota bacterium]
MIEPAAHPPLASQAETTQAAPGSVRAAPETSRSGRKRYVIYLLVLICFEVLITWTQPYADPPAGYGNAAGVVIESHWYLAEARGHVQGVEPGVADEYRRPLISYPAQWIYSLYGVSIPASRALGSLASLVLMVVLAELLRRRYGVTVALVGGLAWITHAGWHAVVRTPSIYPWVALWFLACVIAVADRRLVMCAVGTTMTVVGGVFLHPLVYLALPAIVWRCHAGIAQQFGEMARRLSLLAITALVATASFFLLGEGWPLHDSLGALTERLRSLEDRVGLFAGYPLLLPLAWCGLLLRLGYAGRKPSYLPTACHVTLWSSAVFLALAPGTSYYQASVLAPFLFFLAADALWLGVVLLLQKSRRSPRLLPLPAMLVGTVFLFMQARAAIEKRPECSTGVMAGGIVLLVMLGLPWLRKTARLRIAVPLACVAILASSVPRMVVMLSEPDYSVARANRHLERMLLPTAVCAGPYAHAVTIDRPLGARRLPERGMREAVVTSGCTHLAVVHRRWDPRFTQFLASQGVHIERIDVLQLCRQPLHIYRVRDANPQRSAFEDAVLAERVGALNSAEASFLLVANSDPRNAPAWSRLAAVLLARSDRQGAIGHLLQAVGARPSAVGTQLAAAALLYGRHQWSEQMAFDCLQSAIAQDPNRVEALLALFHVYQQRGYRREALVHLNAAHAAEPGNSLIGELLQRHQRQR